VYWVLNSASLTRVADGADIPCQSLTLSLDVGSWAWGLSATLAGRAAWDLVQRADTDPIEVAAIINGWEWRALIDADDAARRFAQGQYSITGRSLAAALAVPYATPRTYTETEARTAQQLAEQELLYSGFTLDWQMTDWLIPAGVYSYADSTAIEQIGRLAQAAGGIAYADRAARTVLARPRYPLPPWQWPGATPDVELPLAALKSLSLKRADRPEYNAVYVMGQAGGVLGHVYLTGSAADLVAPQVVDPLITHVDAARYRGLTVLAGFGAQQQVSLELPLNAVGGTVPLLTLGQLVAVTGEGAPWLSLVTGVRVSAGRSGRALTVTQQIELERHG
jgi:hypothetical protein